MQDFILKPWSIKFVNVNKILTLFCPFQSFFWEVELNVHVVYKYTCV